MHFQIIWEFNCKSNKNMKSYHVLYENIVSDLFINKYSWWFHLIRREVLSCPSAHVRRGVLWNGEGQGQLRRVTGYVCTQCQQHTKHRNYGRVCKNTSLVHGTCMKVVGSVFLLVSKALLTAPSSLRPLLTPPCTRDSPPAESEAWHIFYSMPGWCSLWCCGRACGSVCCTWG